MILWGHTMKRIWAMAFGVSALLAAGCASVTDRLEGDIPPRTQVFQADPRTTYAAARAALGSMSFRFTRGGPAEGVMEAISMIEPGDVAGTSQQQELRAEFHPTDSGGTAVDVWFRQIEAADSQDYLHPPTEDPLEDTPLYEIFFRGIQQNLPAQAKPASG